MRYLVDGAVFALVFLFALMVFKSAFLAFLAATIVGAAAEGVQGRADRR